MNTGANERNMRRWVCVARRAADRTRESVSISGCCGYNGVLVREPTRNLADASLVLRSNTYTQRPEQCPETATHTTPGAVEEKSTQPKRADAHEQWGTVGTSTTTTAVTRRQAPCTNSLRSLSTRTHARTRARRRRTHKVHKPHDVAQCKRASVGETGATLQTEHAAGWL